MKKNVTRLMKVSSYDRGKIFAEVGIDGYSMGELNYIAGKFGIHVPLERSVRINSIEVSSKKYKYKFILNALTI